MWILEREAGRCRTRRAAAGFGPLLAMDAAVGMGLLFSLAGHVVPESCERKGSGRFLRKRWAQATKGQGQGPRITAVEFCSGLRLVLDRRSCGTSDQRP